MPERAVDLNDKLGKQYPPDNAFKKAARRHQSEYRANVLCVDFDEYGNRLHEAEARGLLAMQLRNEISDFTSIILYPSGNEHFKKAIPKYQSMLNESHRTQVRGCTYEKFIATITGDEDILKWKSYLEKRYLVTPFSAT